MSKPTDSERWKLATEYKEMTMTVRELIKDLKRQPQDGKIEFYAADGKAYLIIGTVGKLGEIKN